MLELKEINVRVGTFTVSSVNLTVEKGDYFVLAGPSGAGKTILLETIAGINKPTSGQIFFAGKEISHLPSGKRKIGLVFQDNTSFPHLSVKNNILFALKLQKLRQDDTKTQLQELADGLGITHLLERMPSTLSGGEVQRVILARTLASKPKVLLLDEPLSSVDSTGKDQLKALLRNLNRKGQTIIHVTHDFEEAISLATKAGIMNSGRIIDQGSVESVFYFPKNEFTARFCGYRNFFYAESVQVGKVRINENVSLVIENILGASQKVAVLIPEDSIEISDHPFSNDSANIFPAEITDITRNRTGFLAETQIGIKLFVQVDSSFIKKNENLTQKSFWLSVMPQNIKIIKIN